MICSMIYVSQSTQMNICFSYYKQCKLILLFYLMLMNNLRILAFPKSAVFIYVVLLVLHTIIQNGNSSLLVSLSTKSSLKVSIRSYHSCKKITR